MSRDRMDLHGELAPIGGYTRPEVRPALITERHPVPGSTSRCRIGVHDRFADGQADAAQITGSGLALAVLKAAKGEAVGILMSVSAELIGFRAVAGARRRRTGCQ
jgi:hypothetical protein